jgi:hypothetical protein
LKEHPVWCSGDENVRPNYQPPTIRYDLSSNDLGALLSEHVRAGRGKENTNRSRHPKVLHTLASGRGMATRGPKLKMETSFSSRF